MSETGQSRAYVCRIALTLLLTGCQSPDSNGHLAILGHAPSSPSVHGATRSAEPTPTAEPNTGMARTPSAGPPRAAVGEVGNSVGSQGAETSQAYGAALTPGPRAELRQMLSAPNAFVGKTVTVEGHVRKACTRKGCWMELAEGADRRLPGCRVTFKDYGFFVPTDSAGARARVQGQVAVRRVPPDLVAHLEQEGAHFGVKLEDGTAEEVHIVATGAELWR